MKRSTVAALIGLLLVGCGQPTAKATPTGSPRHTPTPTPSPTPVPTPTPLPPPPNLAPAGGFGAPPGFSAYVYARGLGATTSMAFGPDGRLYVLSAGGSLAVVPSPGAGPQTLVSGLPTALGLAWRGNDLYVSVRTSVRRYQLSNGALSGGGAVVSGLPVSQHQNDWILPMPNGDFLLGVGSTCNVCNEGDSRSASVLRFRSDWSYAGVVVRGARNPYGLALRPSTGEAYVTINGQDNLGSQPADHLLRVSDGEDAGWPRCWPAYPDGSLHGNCGGVAPPVAVFAPHSSADGIVFYYGAEFGADYQENAFVTEWGANVGGSIGRRVMRVVFSGSGASEHGQVTDFATGFSHPLAITEASDGGLLVGDYGTGQITEIFRTS
ncbi:MAG TPA: PQQ-dependent sugar dehydrogenase [Candidatus Dormibacteraeota bacterium]|nr:PQQ-dependent sugar dehydrogenase [Candidatus Dormibacteraeota bacterium]